MPLVNGRYASKNPQWLLNGAPGGVFRENLPAGRLQAVSNMSALTTQIMLSTPLPLQAGDLVTNLTFVSGNTGAGTPTNWWFALHSPASTPALLYQTADQTSTAWAANAAKTLPLTTAYLVPTTGVYWASVMVKATTVPTLMGVSLNHANAATALLSGQVVLAQTSGSSLTDTAPATIASGTAVATVPYCVAT